MDHPNSLKELFERYFAGVSTPGEEARLARMMEKLDPEALSELLAGSWEKTDAIERVIPEAETRQILQRILGKVSKDADEVNEAMLTPLHSPEAVKHAGRKTTWWRYAAVVAGILLLAAAAFFYLPPERAAQPLVETVAPDDLEPGHQGAVLTLADGTKISLEDAGTGVVTLQGRTEVVNLEGELKYRAQTEPGGLLLYNTMSTPKGRQYQLTLSDGTRVWLNAASSITYPISFPETERSVTVSGEAYFEVMPDKRKPFRVGIQGKGQVEVLGTHFNVNAYADEPVVKATLLEGSIRVDNFHDQAYSVLRPGQQAQLGAELAVLDNVNTEEAVAWKNGYFIFNDAGIEAIMRQVTRWYDAKIVYEGNVREERFTGSVPRAEAASKLLEVLELTRTVRFSIEDKKITVKPY